LGEPELLPRAEENRDVKSRTYRAFRTAGKGRSLVNESVRDGEMKIFQANQSFNL